LYTGFLAQVIDLLSTNLKVNILLTNSLRTVIEMKLNLDPPLLEQIELFCRRWRIRSLAVFGSVLGDDFGPESDIDILVTLSPHTGWGLLDHVQMTLDLTDIFNRKVDLITRRGLENSGNWLRRDEILKTARVIYDEGEIIYAPR
jgi:predicted nucleotidyltransferase